MTVGLPIARSDVVDSVRRARQLRPLIETASAAIERERRIVPEVLEALYDKRMFKMLLPRSCGGDETDPLAFIGAIEELAKADASTAWCVAQASGCSLAAAYLEPAVAKEIFEPRDAVLAWGPVGPTVRATAVDGGYRANGKWSYASGSRHAQWLGGHSPLVDAGGKPCLGPDGRPMERTVLFRKEKAAIHDVWQVMGLKGTGSDSYSVTDLLVPTRYTFTREATAERRESGPLYRFTTYQIYGAAFAAVALGISRAALDAFMQMAATKVPMLGSKPLRDNPVVQSKVAVAEAQWKSSRAYLLQTLGEMWDVACGGNNATADQRAQLRLAAVYASHQAKEVIEIAYHFAGGTAVFENQAFERRLRDIHAVTQQVQSQFVNFEVAGQVLLGLPVTSKLI
jgi:alkylation response protein AidB-like acyl-CoA dehydrogenase